MKGRGGPGLRRSPSGPRKAVSGGGSSPASSGSTKTEASFAIVARGPAACAPGALAVARSGTMPGVRPRLGRPRARVSVQAPRGDGARRGQPDRENKGRGSSRAPARCPPLCQTLPLERAVRGRGSASRAGRGAGRACGAAVLHDSVVLGEGPAGLS